MLKNKPDEMLKISSKGTVPVLQFTDKVLDESLDIISWAMNSPTSNIHIYSNTEESLSLDLIHLFDSQFKYHLDRYKYSSRYGVDPKDHQEECKTILENLEDKIDPQPWIFGKEVSLLDISILPFIRQCKIADPDWFFAQSFGRVIDLLNYFENSDLFIQLCKSMSYGIPIKTMERFFRKFL